MCHVETELRMVRDRAWGIWGELKLWRQIENECLSGLINRTSVEDIFQLNSFVGSPQSTDFYFYKQCLLLRWIPKWFWLRRLWNLFYRWSRKRREWWVTFINIANFKRWRLSWFICWQPSGQRRVDSWIPEGGGCWQRIQTNSEWQTRRQYRSQRTVRMQCMARVYYFRAFFDLALKYTFVLTLKSVGFLELF